MTLPTIGTSLTSGISLTTGSSLTIAHVVYEKKGRPL